MSDLGQSLGGDKAESGAVGRPAPFMLTLYQPFSRAKLGFKLEI